MAVTIDIPGVGNVEAKNAASEATLQAILRAMQGVQRNIRGGGGGGGGSSGGGGGSGAAAASSSVTSASAKLGQSLGFAARSLVNFSNGVVGVIDRLSGLGDSVQGAAAVFSNIPIVGTVFMAVAKAVENTTEAFQAASQSGATFGGSINAFAGAASSAGMTLKDFAQLIGQNGESLRLLGGNTEAGGKRFASLARDLRATGKDLYSLGFSTTEVNQGLANYTKLTMQGGRNTNMTNAELVQGSKKYLKEIDLLAKVTGQTRKEQEDAQQKIANEAQFQAAMAGMDRGVRESFLGTISGLPKGLQDVARDIMLTGSATTEESQRFMSMMPNSAAMLASFEQKRARGEEISMDERNRLNNLLAEEGKAAQIQYADIGRYSAEFAKQTNMIYDAAGIQKDALLSGAKAQDASIKSTDGQAAALEAMKQSIAEISNAFQMTLANSGAVLKGMMELLQMFVGVITKYVIPIFQEYLVPAVIFATKVITDLIIPAFVFMVEHLIAATKMVMTYLTPAFTFLGQMIREYVIPTFLHVRNFIQDNLIPVLAGIGTVIAYFLIPKMLSMVAQFIATGISVALSFLPVTAAVVILVAIFKALRDSGFDFKMVMDILGDTYDMIIDKMKSFSLEYIDIWLAIAEKIAKFFGGGESVTAARAEIEAQRNEYKENEKEREARAADRVKTRAANVAAIQADKTSKEAERENDRKQAAAGDYKGALNMPDFKMPELKLGGGGGGGLGGKPSSAPVTPGAGNTSSGPVDFTNMSPEQIAAYYAKSKNPNAATGQNTESTKAAIVAGAVQAEADKIAKAAAEEKSGKPAAAPETAETLLAGVNSRLEKLIAINQQVHKLSDDQLRAMKGLNNNLFAG